MSSSDWLGLVLGLIGIAFNIFFYLFELKGQMDKILLSHKKDLDGFRIEYKHYTEAIMQSHEGTISKNQALNLIELYHGAVSSQLINTLDRYASNDYLPLFSEKNSNAIMIELNLIYDKIVRKSLLPLISPFYLRGDIKADELVIEIGALTVEKSFTEIEKSLCKSLAENKGSGDFIIDIKKILLREIFLNKQECIRKISAIYKSNISKEKDIS